MENMELKREVIDSAVEYINKVVLGIGGIVEDFQSGREDKATNTMAQLIDGLHWLLQAIEGTKDVQGDNFIDISAVNPIFSQLTEAFENTDYVLLGDLLEYELTPIMKNWKERLTFVQEELRNASI
ncbi:MAG: hypothetical protein BWY74_01962 [Firmicutes bacterium ADurb.Bin419]|nr:MAG: hypothetical protein BWY74_01962 [Firmicutes bacterium ADurb.Bin419]